MSVLRDGIFFAYMQKRKIGSLTELSGITGTSISLLCAYNHTKKIPSLFTALDIAQALGTTVEEIWGGQK